VLTNYTLIGVESETEANARWSSKSYRA